MKDTTKQGPARKRKPVDKLTQRARAIIGNAKRYDPETRRAIPRALTEGHAHLLACVESAEAGEMVNDLTKAQVEANARQQELTRELTDFAGHLSAALTIALTNEAIPGAFYNALAEAWNDFI